jgi:hypothetical protein
MLCPGLCGVAEKATKRLFRKIHSQRKAKKNFGAPMVLDLRGFSNFGDA